MPPTSTCHPRPGSPKASHDGLSYPPVCRPRATRHRFRTPSRSDRPSGLPSEPTTHPSSLRFRGEPCPLKTLHAPPELARPHHPRRMVNIWRTALQGRRPRPRRDSRPSARRRQSSRNPPHQRRTHPGPRTGPSTGTHVGSMARERRRHALPARIEVRTWRRRCHALLSSPPPGPRHQQLTDRPLEKPESAALAPPGRPPRSPPLRGPTLLASSLHGLGRHGHQTPRRPRPIRATPAMPSPGDLLLTHGDHPRLHRYRPPSRPAPGRRPRPRPPRQRHTS